MLKHKITKKFFANIQFVYMGYLCITKLMGKIDGICQRGGRNLQH